LTLVGARGGPGGARRRWNRPEMRARWCRRQGMRGGLWRGRIRAFAEKGCPAIKPRYGGGLACARAQGRTAGGPAGMAVCGDAASAGAPRGGGGLSEGCGARTGVAGPPQMRIRWRTEVRRRSGAVHARVRVASRRT
jgi:hypothetical protein